MESPDAVHHVLELLARMQDGGAEVERARQLPEACARDHAYTWDRKYTI